MIDKNELLNKLIIEVEGSLRRARCARETSQSDANEAPGAMVSRYDSAKEESQYLAGAHRQREAVIEGGLASLIVLQRELSKYPPSNKAVVGAVLTLESEGRESHVFLAPYGGGTVVECNGIQVLVVTKNSPLGCALWGLAEGDSAFFEKGKFTQEFEILEIY